MISTTTTVKQKRGQGKIHRSCRLLASSAKPQTIPSAVLRCSWSIPLNYREFRPDMVVLSRAVKKTWISIDHDFETLVNCEFDDLGLMLLAEEFSYSTVLILPLELDIDVHGSLLCEWVHNQEEQDGTSAKHLVKIKVQVKKVTCFVLEPLS